MVRTRNGRFERSTSKTVSHLQIGPESLGLLAHQVHQLRPLDSLGKPGEIVDGGRQGQLAAGLLALEDQRGQVGPRGVQGGGQARPTRTR